MSEKIKRKNTNAQLIVTLDENGYERFSSSHLFVGLKKISDYTEAGYSFYFHGFHDGLIEKPIFYLRSTAYFIDVLMVQKELGSFNHRDDLNVVKFSDEIPLPPFIDLLKEKPFSYSFNNQQSPDIFSLFFDTYWRNFVEPDIGSGKSTKNHFILMSTGYEGPWMSFVAPYHVFETLSKDLDMIGKINLDSLVPFPS